MRSPYLPTMIFGAVLAASAVAGDCGPAAYRGVVSGTQIGCSFRAERKNGGCLEICVARDDGEKYAATVGCHGMRGQNVDAYNSGFLRAEEIEMLADKPGMLSFVDSERQFDLRERKWGVWVMDLRRGSHFLANLLLLNDRNRAFFLWRTTSGTRSTEYTCHIKGR